MMASRSPEEMGLGCVGMFINSHLAERQHNHLSSHLWCERQDGSAVLGRRPVEKNAAVRRSDEGAVVNEDALNRLQCEAGHRLKSPRRWCLVHRPRVLDTH